MQHEFGEFYFLNEISGGGIIYTIYKSKPTIVAQVCYDSHNEDNDLFINNYYPGYKFNYLSFSAKMVTYNVPKNIFGRRLNKEEIKFFLVKIFQNLNQRFINCKSILKEKKPVNLHQSYDITLFLIAVVANYLQSIQN